MNRLVKQMNLSYAIVALVFLVSGCAMTKSKQGASSDLVGKKWQLIEVEGNTVQEKVNGKMPYLELGADGRYAANGGCNGIGGNYEWKRKNGIKFNRGMSTMMACNDMSAERGLLNLIENADRYHLEDEVLIFTQGNGAPLAKFRSTANESSEENKTTALEGSWELDYVIDPDGNDFEELYAARKPILTFEEGATKVSGNSSCNNFSGKVTINGQRIQFSPLAMTRMACPGDGERVFTQALQKVTTFDVQGETLNFVMDDIAIMRFKKQ